MRLTVLGSADAFHGAGRGHAGLLLEDASGRLLVDCGATVPQALARRGLSPNDVNEVVITHLHGDHFAGVPFLLLAGMYAGPRTTPLVVAGPVHAASRIEALFRILYRSSSEKPRPFFLDYREFEPDQAIDVGGRRVVALKAAHMSPPESALALRIESEGRIVAYSGDTGPGAELARVADGADLFVCECTHGAGGEGEDHLTVADVARLRPGWRARRVVLTHLSARARAEAQAIPDVVVADDGDAFEL